MAPTHVGTDAASHIYPVALSPHFTRLDARNCV
jgi:hypothetical protein